MYLLGYDIGSSSIKVALIDAENQDIIDIVQYPEQEMEMISRQKGWAEQQPELWWKYLCVGTKKILSKNKIDSKDILSIGIAYQMHGLVIVDEDYQVLRPSIIWCDSRAVYIGDKAFQKLGPKFCLENYQNSPGNFTASKLKWVKDNEPDIYKKIHKVMLPGDYIAMKLTGRISTTVSGLSEGVLWNFKEQKIAKRLLDYYGIDQSLIADVLPTFSIVGNVSTEASKETGLNEQTTISYRAGDQPNNALCLNVLKPGEIAATSGTSGVVYGVVDKTIYDETSRVNAFAHVNHSNKKNRIGVLLCINGAGIQYGWLKNQVARPNKSYEDMERMLSSVPVGSEGVVILPFGNGAERIFNNKNIESHIHNIQFNRHTRAHLYRAALEGVAFTFVLGIHMLKDMGMEIKKLRVGNDNMFRSEVFSTTISTLLNLDLEVVETTGAVGAAIASGHGCGHYKSIESVMSKVKPSKIFKPAMNDVEYVQAYRYWKDYLDERINQRKNTIPQEDISSEIDSKNKLIAKQSLLIQDQEKKLLKLKQSLLNMANGAERHDIRKLISNLDKYAFEFESISKHIDLLSDPYIEHVKSLFPNLSYEDLELCYYLKLKFSTKEIADKLNLSYRGAETKRYRLRQKLSIKKGTTLTAYLDTL